MSEHERGETSGMPTAEQPALPVMDYSTPAPLNIHARRAVIHAALSFLPFVPGILAIRHGRRGVRDADADPKLGGRSASRAAMIIGGASVVVWTMLVILAVPATIKARQQAIRVQCASNLRQISLGLQMYASGNKGYLPPNIDVLVASGVVPATLFTCPACVGDPTKPVSTTGTFGSSHYVYLGNGRRLTTIRRASDEVLVYEPLTNHADGGINTAYADGHVELHAGTSAAALLQQLAAAATQPAATTSPAADDATIPSSPLEIDPGR